MSDGNLGNLFSEVYCSNFIFTKLQKLAETKQKSIASMKLCFPHSIPYFVLLVFYKILFRLGHSVWHANIRLTVTDSWR
jgi:hypothetical protein